MGLNLQTIETLKAELQDDSIIAEVIASYQRSTPKHIEAMKKLLAEGKIEQLAKEAHSLKSSSKALGAEKLGDYCQELEDLKGASDIQAVSKILIELEEEYKIIAAELGAW